jgi:hypothetical protein
VISDRYHAGVLAMLLEKSLTIIKYESSHKFEDYRMVGLYRMRNYKPEKFKVMNDQSFETLKDTMMRISTDATKRGIGLGVVPTKDTTVIKLLKEQKEFPGTEKSRLAHLHAVPKPSSATAGAESDEEDLTTTEQEGNAEGGKQKEVKGQAANDDGEDDSLSHSKKL